MNKNRSVQELARAATWAKDLGGKQGLSAEDGWRMQNVMVGAILLINQCGRSVQGWLDREPGRRGALKRVQKGSRRGGKALRDLLGLAISELEAAVWLDEVDVGPLPIGKEPKKLSEAQKRAMQQGAARKRRKKKEARERRLKVTATR